MISGTFSHGPWTLYKDHWSEPWKARHTGTADIPATGEIVETGQHHVERARETLAMPDQTDRPGYTTGGTVTIQPRRTTANPRGWDVA